MEEMDKDRITKNQDSSEIDVIEIARKLWTNRIYIVRLTTIFTAIGLIIAIFTPNEFTATTTMVPQTGEKKAGGSLSGLAAMAGINLGSMSNGDMLSPSVYPRILKNVNFQKELIYSSFDFKKSDKRISYYEYSTNKTFTSFNLIAFVKKYTIGLPNVIIGGFKKNSKELTDSIEVANSNIIELTVKESNVIKTIFSKLHLKLNDKEGYITLSYTSAEPKLSAEVVLTAQKLLQKYITEFKIEKVRRNLEFVDKSYNEAKENFENKQLDLAKFRDENNSLSSAIAKTQEEKLLSEYDLYYSIYTEIAKQKEQAKFAVTENTPLLTIIEPVVIPTEKSGPKRFMIIVLSIISGIILGFVFVIFKNILNKDIS